MCKIILKLDKRYRSVEGFHFLFSDQVSISVSDLVSKKFEQFG